MCNGRLSCSSCERSLDESPAHSDRRGRSKPDGADKLPIPTIPPGQAVVELRTVDRPRGHGAIGGRSIQSCGPRREHPARGRQVDSGAVSQQRSSVPDPRPSNGQQTRPRDRRYRRPRNPRGEKRELVRSWPWPRTYQPRATRRCIGTLPIHQTACLPAQLAFSAPSGRLQQAIIENNSRIDGKCHPTGQAIGGGGGGEAETTSLISPIGVCRRPTEISDQIADAAPMLTSFSNYVRSRRNWMRC